MIKGTRCLGLVELKSQIFDSHKWPTVLVRRVKGKPRNFEANLCGSLYSTFKTSFKPYAFCNKRIQMLFIDQLVRSKAMCSFKTIKQTKVQKLFEVDILIRHETPMVSKFVLQDPFYKAQQFAKHSKVLLIRNWLLC